MIQVTVDLPDELAERLDSRDVSQVLQAGLQFLEAQSLEFSTMVEVLEFLAKLPQPQEVLALRPSEELQERIRVLLDRSELGGLTGEDRREWEQYEYLEHVVRMAKGRSLCLLGGKS
ncbi:MAG: hypothetical protein ACFCA4_04830 [Cyanophyceae cyanobacterium]